ncbi:hypothetical protein CcI49_03075 [Frankia sp. CcI49]|uniref:hypothetical protein n=1 Tax=Frankia sp. CcI49 TaxID=1745382 RepID=UPI000976E1B7|nr:hypothetical protein [Frankia sp. CcI49]ONH62376.1 hypothetical protein CcI49_03075 [Frankia sp. CcI49]
MSDRYEHIEAAGAEVELLGPGAELGDNVIADHAVVIGDPGATALVVEGSLNELTALVGALAAVLLGPADGILPYSPAA